MENSRAKKSMKNVIIMMIYEVVVMICGLITPRLILSSFGSAYNGLISSITQFLSFIAILRAGVAGATRVSLYKSLANGDILTTSRILKATEKYLRRIAYVFLGYLLVLSLTYKYLSATDIPWIECFSLVLIIGIGTFAQYYFGLTYQTLLAADQKNYVYYIQQIIVTLLNTFIAVILIKLGCSIQIVKLGSAIIFVASPILLNKYVSNKYKIEKNCEPNNEALKQKNDVLGLAIANIVHDNTDVAILTLFSDIKIVSVYAVYNMVLGGIKKVLSVFTTGLEAAFGNMWAKNEKKAIERNIGIYELLIFSFISIVFSSTIILILPFIKIYTQGITDVEYIIPVYAIVAVLAQAFYCARMPYMTLVQAAGHYKQTRNGSFVEAGLNLVISILLVHKFSIVGVGIGTLVADIYRTIQYAKYCCDNLIEKKYTDILKRMLWTILNVSISVALYSLMKDSFTVDSWISWISLAVVVASFSSISTLITAFVFYKNDINNAYTILKKIFKRKNAVTQNEV